jgi:ferritin-like metal-binding protein YciE
MPPSDLQEQLVKHLTDCHSIEVQALVQMKAAPKILGDEELAKIYEEHEKETEEHKRLVEERLEAHGASRSIVKDVAGAVGGVPMVLFAKFNPDTPGKLANHALSYEHMEHAAYELLERIARRAGDTETAEVARRIAEQELAMAERIEASFDRTVELSLADVPSDDLTEQLTKYLADAHAIENQAIELLRGGKKIIGEGELAKLFDEHLEETRAQQKALETRLEALGGSPNKLQDAAMRLGGINIGGFFGVQPDTPAKLAGFAHAFEMLEVAAYEQLSRVAERAGDEETVRVAKRILGEERAMAGAIHAHFSDAVDATIDKRDLAAR